MDILLLVYKYIDIKLLESIYRPVWSIFIPLILGQIFMYGNGL